MNTFPARFGIWHDHTVLFMQKELFGEHEMILVERKHDGISDRPRRELRLYRGGSCSINRVAESNIYTYDMWPYYFRSTTVNREGFCRCGPLDILMQVSHNGLYWYSELPPNHELPWPHIRDCKSYEKPEELMAECMMRSESARLHGEQMSAPPPHIQMELTPSMRVKLFTVVKN